MTAVRVAQGRAGHEHHAARGKAIGGQPAGNEGAPICWLLGQFHGLYAVGKGQSPADGRIVAEGDDPNRRLAPGDGSRGIAAMSRDKSEIARHGLKSMLNERG